MDSATRRSASWTPVAALLPAVACGWCLQPPPANLSKVRYKGVDYAVPIGYGFGSSSQPAAHVLRILVAEMLGVQAELVGGLDGSASILRAVAGCSGSMSCSQEERERGAFLDPPGVWLAAEVWAASPEERGLVENVERMGPSGYITTPSLHSYGRVHRLAEERGEYLYFWMALFRPEVQALFSDVNALDSTIRALAVPHELGHFFGCEGVACDAPGHVVPGSDNGQPTGSDVWGQLKDDGFDVEEGWFYAPACRSNRAACIPVVLGDRLWNFREWCAVAVKQGLPFAITFLGWYGERVTVNSLVDQNHSFLFYWWRPDDTFLELSPKMVLFDDSILPIRQFQQPEKIAWQGLNHAHADLFHFFERVEFSNEDMEAFMRDFGVKDHDTMACDWLRANQGLWGKWFPDRRTCAKGFFYEVSEGMCKACRRGTIAAETGLRACEVCQVGRHAPDPGSFACTSCAAGKVSGSAGAWDCTLCPRGSFANTTASSSCLACPAGFTTAGVASERQDACVCDAGSYEAKGARRCESCPRGMSCELGSKESNLGTSGQRPQLMDGFMARLADPFEVYECMPHDVCQGIRDPGVCGLHHADPDAVACGECSPGAFMDGEGICELCEGKGSALGLVAFLAAGVPLLVLVTYAVNRDALMQRDSATVTIVLLGLSWSSFQTLAVFQGIKLQWAEPLRSVLKTMSLLGCDFRYLRMECVVAVSPVSRLLCRQLMAPGCLPVIAATLLLKRWRAAQPVVVWEQMANTTGTVLLVFYISLVLAALTPLVCYQHPGTSGESMVSAPSILCFVSSQHRAMVAIGLVSFLLVPLPFLVACAYGVQRYPHYVANAMHGGVSMLRAFRFLFHRFKPEAYFYGLVLLVRNLSLCLVPVVIRDMPAAQVATVSFILLLGALVQTLMSPWRSRLPNVIDGAVSLTMVLVMLCGVMSSDIRVSSVTITTISCVVLALFIVPLATALTYSACLWLRPRPFYEYFISHHKASAGAQARLLQLMIREATGKSCFLDSDHLTNLNQLLDVVCCKINHFVVYLTCDTLARPWCAGEIVAAFKNRKRTTAVVHPTFVPPTDAQLKDSDSLLGVDSANLVQYNICMGDVVAAYRWLLSDDVRAVTLPSHLLGRAKFDEAICSIVRRGSRSSVLTAAVSNWSEMLVVSSDPADDEATASASILISKAQRHLCGFVHGGVCMLADSEPLPSQQLYQCFAQAHAVLVLLTGGSLSSHVQLWQLVAAMRTAEEVGLPVVPVAIPAFKQPGAAYYGEELAKLWPGDTAAAARLVRAFFNLIYVPLPVHAAEANLDAAAEAAVGRIPKYASMREASTMVSDTWPVNVSVAPAFILLE